MTSISIVLALGLAIILPVAAQAPLGLRIDTLRSEDFPQVVADVSVLDGQGIPVTGLAAANLTAAEDGQPITNLAVVPIYEHALDIVLLIDTSNTMQFGSPPLALEKVVPALGEFLGELSTTDRLAVVSFASEIRVEQSLTTDRAGAQSAMRNLVAAGDTALNDALVDGLRLLKDQAARPVIILLTDGFDSGISEASFSEVLEAADAQNVPVFSVGWRSARQADLEQLAELTRGSAIYARENEPDLQWYQAALRRIQPALRDLRLQYRLSFQSTLPADGREYELVVKLDHLGQHQEARRSFASIAREIAIDLPGYADGQVVGGYVIFNPEVVAPSALRRMTLLVNGTEVDTVNTAPFEITWDASAYPTGSYTVVLEVEDSNGNLGQTGWTLNVQPPVQVSLTSPVNGATVSGKDRLAAEVSALTQVASVEFWVDDRLYQSIHQEPYEVEWDLAGLNAGLHEVRVVATTVEGFTAEDQVGITVAVQGGFGLAWLAVIAAAALAAILVPLGLRRRKRVQAALSGDSLGQGAAGAGGGQAILRELEGANPDHAWPLYSPEVRLGRKREENDIPLKGLQASRQHAIIRNQQGQHVVYSLNPENPILVNDMPVTGSRVLHPGDILRAGDTVLRYEG